MSTLFYGADIASNFVSSQARLANIQTQEYEPTDTRYPDGSQYHATAIYLSHKWRPGGKWTINSGIRMNEVPS